MPGSRRMLWLAIGVLATIAVPVGAVYGGRWNRFCWRIWMGRRRCEYRSGGPAGDGRPVRAHAGDVVRVDAVIENKAEGSRTTRADLLATGRW